MQRLDLGIRLSGLELVVGSNVDGSPYLADTDFTVEDIHLILMLRSWLLRFSFLSLSAPRVNGTTCPRINLCLGPEPRPQDFQYMKWYTLIAY